MTDLGLYAFESLNPRHLLSFGVEENGGKGKTGSRVGSVVGMSGKSDTVQNKGCDKELED